MSIFSTTTGVWQSRMLSVLRMVAAALLIFHGTQKLFGVPASEWGTAPLMSTMGLAGILETVLGALLLVGLLSRVAAFVLSGQLAVAYFMVHAPQAFLPIQNQGELAALYSFLFLYIAVAGPGVWSVDQMIDRHREGQVQFVGPAEQRRARAA